MLGLAVVGWSVGSWVGCTVGAGLVGVPVVGLSVDG